ncbi:MAG: PepSY domain-containing protein [Rhizobiales bacterium]|nr:PepSY domain-containing protein [Hyphomicrobiales bacterium]
MPARRVVLAFLLSLPPVGPLLADRASHEEARRALERGEVQPLARILDLARPALAGDVVRTELERDDGRWIYEFRVVTPDGRRIEVKVDAATGEVLRMKGKR